MAERLGVSVVAVACASAVHWLFFRGQGNAVVAPYIAAVVLTAWLAGPKPASIAFVLAAPAAVLLSLALSTSALPVFQASLDLLLLGGICAVAIRLRASFDRERESLARVKREREEQARLAMHMREIQDAERADLDRTRVQAALQARLAAINQLSSSVAHDLRNPLGVIRNAVYLLRRRLARTEVKSDLLNMIEDEVRSADAIITNLMESTRGREPERCDVDLSALVSELTARIDGTGRVQWIVEFTHSPCLLWCDPGQIRQVLDNLLQNAVEAMKGKGPITIAAWRDGPHDFVEVRDTGPGIAAEVRPVLFDPLVTTKHSGTGLGLMTCRQIVERHGGSIAVIDRNEPGAAFRIALPRKEEAVVAAGAPS